MTDNLVIERTVLWESLTKFTNKTESVLKAAEPDLLYLEEVLEQLNSEEIELKAQDAEI